MAAGALAALAQHQADAAWDMNGLAGLFWVVFRRYAVCAFAGAAVGLAAGLAFCGAKRLAAYRMERRESAALGWTIRRSGREEGRS